MEMLGHIMFPKLYIWFQSVLNPYPLNRILLSSQVHLGHFFTSLESQNDLPNVAQAPAQLSSSELVRPRLLQSSPGVGSLP